MIQNKFSMFKKTQKNGGLKWQYPNNLEKKLYHGMRATSPNLTKVFTS